jgi:hypothetical protein
MTALTQADLGRRREFLVGLSQRLSAAVGVAEFVAATDVDAPGVQRVLRPGTIRLGGRLLTSPVPDAVITLDPPEDARWLAQAWRLEHGVIVSGDAGQTTWHLAEVTGDLGGSAGARRLAVSQPTAGRWDLRARLLGRPTGPLPSAVAGASPAYELSTVGGAVAEVEVRCATRRVEVLSAGDHDARRLLADMAQRWPSWGTGWELAPDEPFVVVYHADEPVVGAALRRDEHGTPMVVRMSVSASAEPGDAGSALLDALEALTLDAGEHVLRLDGSVFLGRDVFPYERHGYVVGPPYAGDADVEVWAERSLT